jgi:DNA-binding NtrC family response regulator
MKKVLIAHDLKSLCLDNNSALDRADIMVFTGTSNDELLKIHTDEKVDLIVTKLDMHGMMTEELFDAIKQRKELQAVATILVCEEGMIHKARSGQCNANVVLTIPVEAVQLHAKIRQFLDIAPRQSYRVTLNVAVEGKFKNKAFLYRTDNISTTGMLISAVTKTDEVLTVGDRLAFSFYLPDGTRVSARGTVERVIQRELTPEVCLYGVKFNELPPVVKTAIEAFVKKELSFKLALGIQ